MLTATQFEAPVSAAAGSQTKSKPALVIVGTFLSSSGGRVSIAEELSRRLRARGWPVITVGHQAGKLSRLLEVASTLWKQRKHYQVAQVELYSGRAFIWAESACYLLSSFRRPFILVLHGGNLPAFSQRHARRVRRLLQKAAAVIAPSDYLRSALTGLRADIGLLPNGIELASYPHRVRSHPSPRLVWLRALHNMYNPVLAVEVLARLAADFPHVTLTLVGPDKGDGSLGAVQRRAHELGVGSRVTLTGPVPKDEVGSVLNAGDIFLNTANVDNTPVSLLEALACGLCVVSTNVGGIPHLVESEQQALLVPPADPEAMAQAVRRILRDDALARSLSVHARAHALHFDWNEIIPRWEQLFAAHA